MTEWFRNRWVNVCEVCGDPFGETTGELEQDGGLVMACAKCVGAARAAELRQRLVTASLRSRSRK